MTESALNLNLISWWMDGCKRRYRLDRQRTGKERRQVNLWTVSLTSGKRARPSNLSVQLWLVQQAPSRREKLHYWCGDSRRHSPLRRQGHHRRRRVHSRSHRFGGSMCCKGILNYISRRPKANASTGLGIWSHSTFLRGSGGI